MNKIIINPSIAVEIDISPISFDEKVKLFFTSDENWVGDFDFRVWNSNQKNTEIEVSSSLLVVAKIMTLAIEPIVQVLPPKEYWYEISSLSTKRLLFKGKLNIVK
jgi:hypothetical protein